MNPKKFKDIVLETSEELDFDKQLVSEVLDFYWASVRKSIGNITHPRINIDGLGIFRIKPTILEKVILKYNITMGGFKSPNFQAYPRYQALKQRSETLEKAKEVLRSEYDRLQEIKKQKNENISRGMEGEG